MIAKAPAALAESTARAEHLVENFQPLADVSEPRVDRLFSISKISASS
jgi:hypothetical protein